jgi:alpha-glucosidase (family GH31 glycosyl hydrolase)
MRPEIFDILNSTLYLRYSLIPFFYTELYRATKYGTIPIRPIAFQYPTDVRTFTINNQWMWGDKLMVTIGNSAVIRSQVFI